MSAIDAVLKEDNTLRSSRTLQPCKQQLLFKHQLIHVVVKFQ
jgi:hypothetical protein